jgi:hypothetical protein
MWRIHFPRLQRLPGMLIAFGGFALTIAPSDVVKNVKEFVGLYTSAPDWISVSTFRLIFLSVAIVGLAWCLWPSRKKTEATPEESADEIKTIYDYYRTDFDVMSIDNELTIDIDPRPTYKIRSLLDYEAGCRYAAIYVPHIFDDPAKKCMINFITQCDKILDLMHSQMHLSFADIGDQRAAPADDLAFTGRIIVYYAAQLSIKDLADLESMARDGVSITWRGSQYATARYLASKMSQQSKQN